MKKIILDTSFILSAVREKIDFFSELTDLGFNIIIPKEVLLELNGIILSKQKEKFKNEAKISLNILKKEKFDFITLESRNVDLGIINLLKKNPSFFLASLDRGLNNKVKNRKVIIRARKKLEII